MPFSIIAGSSGGQWCGSSLLHCCRLQHHNNHQISQSSHSISAIYPAPHQGGRNREHRSIVFATDTHSHVQHHPNTTQLFCFVLFCEQHGIVLVIVAHQPNQQVAFSTQSAHAMPF
jgi:hypothetical protein